MGVLRSYFTPLHASTKRDYLSRMCDAKVECMQVAKQFGADFWDGDRRYGYGGFKYDGRWKPVAERLIADYGLDGNCSILDIGCGKGFLLYELQQLLPDARIVGFDISDYAIANAKEEIRHNLFIHRAQDPLPFKDHEFDLVISLTTLHNLHLPDLKAALGEMARVGRQKYLGV